MATTKQSMEEDGKSFGDSFNEEAVAPVEQSEDEAFGLNLPSADDAAAEGDGETDGSEVAVASSQMPEELPAEPPAEEVAAAQSQAEAGQDDMPEMSQAEKSWEGRLRAREAELKALAEHLDQRKNAPDESATSQQEEAAESPAEESAEGCDGEADEAMRQLSEDFGPEFVKMICAIAKKMAATTAGEQVKQVGDTVQSMIEHFNDADQKRHYKEIAAAHPDFASIPDSEPFNAFVSALPPTEQADAYRVIQNGDSQEINALLSAFKASAPTGDDEDGLDAAEGVRSTGIRLPSQPSAGADDFAAAWDEQT